MSGTPSALWGTRTHHVKIYTPRQYGVHPYYINTQGRHPLRKELLQFGDIHPFLDAHPEVSPATPEKLLQILSDPQKLSYLKVELAAVVDMGECFVKDTFTLEGDSPLVFTCFEVLSVLTAAFQTAHYPNLEALSKILAPGLVVLQQQWMDYGKACIKPALDFLVPNLSMTCETLLKLSSLLGYLCLARSLK